MAVRLSFAIVVVTSLDIIITVQSVLAVEIHARVFRDVAGNSTFSAFIIPSREFLFSNPNIMIIEPIDYTYEINPVLFHLQFYFSQPVFPLIFNIVRIKCTQILQFCGLSVRCFLIYPCHLLYRSSFLHPLFGYKSKTRVLVHLCVI